MPHSLRGWPYPYQAGLTISNDAEFMNFSFFEDLMAFLNTRRETALGTGLGLEVTSSVFHFTCNPYNFSIFEGSDNRGLPSKHARRIDDYLRAGWVDTLHAYGDFDGHGGFHRTYAERCMDHLSKVGVKVPIFTNHGGVENIQNIGHDAEYHRGDHPNHSAYHSDLLDAMGVRYVWTDSMVIHNLHSEQDSWRTRLRGFRGQLQGANHQPYFNRTDKCILKSIILNDKSKKTGFVRFRGTGSNAPNLSSLGYQLSQIPWATFYKNSYGVVLYQHLGVLHKLNNICQASTIEAMKKRPEVFLIPFRFLSQESDAGRLWVVGCARFLNYLYIRDNIEVETDASGKIHLKSSLEVRDAQVDFQGVTVYIKPNLFNGLYHNHTRLEVLTNGPDETGEYSVSIPMRKLEDIWP